MRKIIAAIVLALGLAVGIGTVVSATSSFAGPNNCKGEGCK
jgi:hypothetical protein